MWYSYYPYDGFYIYIYICIYKNVYVYIISMYIKDIHVLIILQKFFSLRFFISLLDCLETLLGGVWRFSYLSFMV